MVMRDLKSAKLIYLKAILFLAIGLLSAALLLCEHPSVRQSLLLAIAVWAFCRLYYFIFYVIEHYVDPSYRFAGLWSFAVWAARRARQSDSKRERKT
jgi:hypothetical protein